MEAIKDIAMGGLYVVSGIYSFGFSAMLERMVRPISGATAYVTVPDGLFPIEVTMFAIFGIVFVAAAAYHFHSGIKSFLT